MTLSESWLPKKKNKNNFHLDKQLDAANQVLRICLLPKDGSDD